MSRFVVLVSNAKIISLPFFFLKQVYVDLVGKSCDLRHRISVNSSGITKLYSIVVRLNVSIDSVFVTKTDK